MRLRLGWTVLVGAALLSGALHQTHGDGLPEGLRVLFPADQSVLESGRFEVICALPEGVSEAPRLRVDGKTAKWEPYALPVLTARLDLKPGPHSLALGPTKLRVYVRGEAAPPQEFAEWPVFRSHPPELGDMTQLAPSPTGIVSPNSGWRDCTVCHEVTEEGGRQTLGALKEPAACQQCHSSEDFQLAHFHPEKPLAGCHQCHALHGSSAKSLLKAPVKKLCAACHD